MKLFKVISIAVLFLFLGSIAPAYAQKGEEEKGGGGQKPQQPQHAQPAQRTQQQPQHAQPAQRTQQQPQRTQQAQRTQQQPQRSQQAQRTQQQPQRTQQAQRSSRQQSQPVANNHGAGQYGRISNASYSSHFGHDHSFHMGRPRRVGGYNRFQYGGYWFGYNQAWPVGWGYDDDVYVEYTGGYYYMYDLMHPGIHVTLSIF